MISNETPEVATLLADIVFWGRRIASHIRELDYERFANDPVKIDAICWCISCLGEAAGRTRTIAPDFAMLNPEIELSKAYAMRNRIAHGYQSIDLEIIWNTVNLTIPGFVEAASAQLAAH